MNFFKKNFFSVILSALSLLLFFYVFYKSEIIWGGKRTNYYIIYYILSILLIFFSFITFYLKKKTINYLTIISLSVFTSLYLSEYFLTYQSSKDRVNIKNIKLKSKLYKEKEGKNFDIRTKFQIFFDENKQNKNVKIFFSPKTYFLNNNSIFPLAGFSNTNIIYCNENGYYSKYLSDRYGFNNNDEEWDKNKIQYLLVGDSFTHGACVNRPNDIASKLKKFSKKPVLNLGYGGNGPLTEYAILREYLPSKVEKVIWLFFENDFEDLYNELTNKILIKYYNDESFSQNLINNQNNINNLLNRALENELKKKFKFKNFFKLTNVRSIINNFLPKGLQPKYDIREKEFQRILFLANKLIEENNSKLYFVYLPSYEQYQKNYDNSIYFLVKNTIKNLNIPFIDIHNEVFKKEKIPTQLFPFGEEGHYNKEGYEKIAKTIFDKTNNN